MGRRRCEPVPQGKVGGGVRRGRRVARPATAAPPAATASRWRVPESAVAVRDSKDPDGPRLVVTPDEWRAFAAGVKAGEFDLS